jgi:hypothetical protein
MRPLDELRNDLGAEYDKGQGVTRYRMDDIFTAFEAAHPGLVDMTTTCPKCGRKMRAATVENNGQCVSVAWAGCPVCTRDVQP